jgi:hypothetical protein
MKNLNWFLDDDHHQNLLNHSAEKQETICLLDQAKPKILLQKIDFIIVFLRKWTISNS